MNGKKIRQARYARKLLEETIKAYGSKCDSCPQNNIILLKLGALNNLGRFCLLGKWIASYRSLRNAGWPNGYVIRCKKCAALKNAALEKKICTKCGKTKPKTEFRKAAKGRLGLHSWCKDCHRLRLRQDYWENHEKRLEWVRKWRAANHPRLLEIWKRSRDKLKKEVIDAYGGCCTCCGEPELEFLTIEHPNHDGKEHRKRAHPSGMYRDLKRRGYPKDVTVFCWNCNMATRYGAVCPHKKHVNISAVATNASAQ